MSLPSHSASPDPQVSVIICTHNRGAGLRRTLETLGANSLPKGWNAEVILVDNGSTDDTAQIIKSSRLPNAELRYLYEGRVGLSNARNAGLRQARGQAILFTDDDVLLPADWVRRLGSPLLEGKCEAVTGGITLAPHLERPWMGHLHRIWLASSHNADTFEGKQELIGANMGFRRSVLDRVPAFDPELGAGALGVAEETLFSWQLLQAGYEIQFIPNAELVHVFDATRLRRNHWLKDAGKRGRTWAYLTYHWEHTSLPAPRLTRCYYAAKLHLRRALQRPPPLDTEGCPAWEMSYVLHMEMCRQFCIERRRPHNYSRRGLTKRPPAT